jgi:hypothetical protein
MIAVRPRQGGEMNEQERNANAQDPDVEGVEKTTLDDLELEETEADSVQGGGKVNVQDLSFTSKPGTA